ncbi:uncharacterized protein B0J16DRAFT_391077 [Fusarium flagelliforme]|uniref:uncharacterized protein n=1 Tax=Fusarium flagelliforme TaxID=2675880 RepID=UPI001E8CBEE7|nr:uncharacterized protein B0J16DRAFT_391077 [Fusarium flagelliforme]KAH7197295.1 hypothetical protein B0J16DRAFT_391077 [Fusarium flagelliforme]
MAVAGGVSRGKSSPNPSLHFYSSTVYPSSLLHVQKRSILFRLRTAHSTVAVNLRFPENDHSTLHLSCYAHGIGIDSKRLAHLTVFVKDVIQASANEHPNPETSLAEYCAEAKTFGDIPTVLSVTTKAAFLRIAQGTSHMLIDISRGERPLSQLKLLQENVYPTGSSTEESSLEITLLLSPEQHDYAVRFAKIINDRKEKEIQSDPLAPFFLHAPDARTLTIGQAPTPGSEGFPTNVAGYQFTHFANADQHLLHNIASLIWEQAIQERKIVGLAE